MCELLLPVYDGSASKNKSPKSVTFTPAAVKSNIFAPLHWRKKRLKACVIKNIFHYDQ